MMLDSIKDLEREISRAIKIIAGLKEEKESLKKENESLRRQIEEYRAKADDYRNRLSAAASDPRLTRADFDEQAIKARLEKLVGKLAALEDSWN